jgi:hypothetical protein
MKNLTTITQDQAISDIIKTINFKITKCTISINKDKAKLADNFTHYFEWCCKDIFMAEFKKSFYNSLLSDLMDESRKIKAIDHYIKICTLFTLNVSNIRSYSSSELANASSTWKFVAQMELLEEFKEFKEHQLGN